MKVSVNGEIRELNCFNSGVDESHDLMCNVGYFTEINDPDNANLMIPCLNEYEYEWREQVFNNEQDFNDTFNYLNNKGHNYTDLLDTVDDMNHCDLENRAARGLQLLAQSYDTRDAL